MMNAMGSVVQYLKARERQGATAPVPPAAQLPRPVPEGRRVAL
jgi:hypothetical protein